MSNDANYFSAVEHDELPSSAGTQPIIYRHVILADRIRLYNDWVQYVFERLPNMEVEVVDDDDDNDDDNDVVDLSDGIIDDFLLEVFGDDHNNGDHENNNKSNDENHHVEQQ